MIPDPALIMRRLYLLAFAFFTMSACAPDDPPVPSSTASEMTASQVVPPPDVEQSHAPLTTAVQLAYDVIRSNHPYKFDASGNAFYIEMVDAMTDEKDGVISVLKADAVVPTDNALMFTCRDETFVASVEHAYMTGDDNNNVKVEYRVPPLDAITTWASLVRSRNSSLLEGQRGLTFAREVMGQEQIIVRVTDPFDGDRVTYTFSTVGVDDLLPLLPCYAAE